MSYDISLYDQAFLRNALQTGLGDWTKATTLPAAVNEAAVSAALSNGFTESLLDEKFIQFMMAQGHPPGREFVLDSTFAFAQMTVFSGSIAFSISSSERAANSIKICSDIARQLARTHGLALFDPQTGEAEFE